MQYVFLAIIAIILVAIIVILKKILTKKLFTGAEWIYPVSPVFGYIYMYFFTTSTDFFVNFKNMILSAFILSMIIVNVKCILIGTKRTINSGRNFTKEFKRNKKSPSVDDQQNKESDGDK